jgi:hypothetical protein
MPLVDKPCAGRLQLIRESGWVRARVPGIRANLAKVFLRNRLRGTQRARARL